MVTLDPEFLADVKGELDRIAPRDVGPITADRELRDLGLDSVAAAELLLNLEDRLGVTLELHNLEAGATFGDLQEAVRAARAAKA